MGPVAPLIACSGGAPVPHLTTANCQLTFANRHQPPNDTNRQPTTRPAGPKNSQQWKTSKVAPNTWGWSPEPSGPTDKSQPPSTTNRQPTATTTQQPPTDNQAQRQSKMKFCTPTLGDGQTVNGDGHILGLFSAVFSRCLDRDGVQHGPNTNQKWPQTLWEDQTDCTGPFWTSAMAIPGTGYRTTRDGQRAGGVVAFQYARRAKSNMCPKTIFRK